MFQACTGVEINIGNHEYVWFPICLVFIIVGGLNIRRVGCYRHC